MNLHQPPCGAVDTKESAELSQHRGLGVCGESMEKIRGSHSRAGMAEGWQVVDIPGAGGAMI